MTTRIKDDEAPYVIMRLGEKLAEKQLLLIMATMEENVEGETYTVTFTYKKRGVIGERQC